VSQETCQGKQGETPTRTGGFPCLPFTEVVMAQTNVQTKALSLSDRFIIGFSALLLGGFLVFGVGLANSATIHDTAHDVRHANGFPCH
jgi:cobalt transporter subunit CbtB